MIMDETKVRKSTIVADLQMMAMIFLQHSLSANSRHLSRESSKNLKFTWKFPFMLSTMNLSQVFFASNQDLSTIGILKILLLVKQNVSDAGISILSIRELFTFKKILKIRVSFMVLALNHNIERMSLYSSLFHSAVKLLTSKLIF